MLGQPLQSAHHRGFRLRSAAVEVQQRLLALRRQPPADRAAPQQRRLGIGRNRRRQIALVQAGDANHDRIRTGQVSGLRHQLGRMHALHRVGGRRDLDPGGGLVRGDFHRLDRHPGRQGVRLQLQRSLVAAAGHRQVDELGVPGRQRHHAERVDLKRPVLDLQRHVHAQIAAEQRGGQANRLGRVRSVAGHGQFQGGRVLAGLDLGHRAGHFGRGAFHSQFHRALIPLTFQLDFHRLLDAGLKQDLVNGREGRQAQFRDIHRQHTRGLLLACFDVHRQVDGLRRVSQGWCHFDLELPAALALGDVCSLDSHVFRSTFDADLDRAGIVVACHLQGHGRLGAGFDRSPA